MNSKILTHYKDELEGVVEYANLTRQSEGFEKQFFQDATREEFQYAEILRHILIDRNAYNPDESLKTLEAEARKALESV